MKKILTGSALVLLMTICVRADHSTNSLYTSGSTSSPLYYDHTMAHRLGLGAVFGEPTGLSVKYFFNDTIAIDGVVGVGFFQETHFYTHASVLWHCYDVFPVREGRMPLYFGVGPRIKTRDENNNDDTRFGLRFPVGVSYMFNRMPVDVFAEVAPILDFTPGTRVGFSAGVGVRYWF